MIRQEILHILHKQQEQRQLNDNKNEMVVTINDDNERENIENNIKEWKQRWTTELTTWIAEITKQKEWKI